MTPDYFETAAAFFEDFPAAPVKSEEELWDYFIRKTASAIGCHAATVFEADEIKKILTFKKSTGPVAGDLEGVSFGYQGIAGWCAENKRSVLVNDAENDARFTEKVDYVTGFKTRNVIAVPALSGGRLLGVIEFINSLRGSFSEADLKLASMLTACISRDVHISRLETAVKQLGLKAKTP